RRDRHPQGFRTNCALMAQRKPTEQKRLTGNPGKRALPKNSAEIVALPPRAPVPEHLGHAGSSLYQMILAACEGWLGLSDQAVVIMLAEGADRRADLLERLKREGDVLYTDKGYAYANPAAGMLSTLEKQMTQWLSSLGMTPTDRSRLGLAEVKRVSKLDQLKRAHNS
ncbi:MAG: phage terminase small subunit P27 family, partial [Caulobacteraceae bacterium]|nr:phage terminase small subunit P27 family [Caulobacteraceae bacterium]